MKIKLNPLLMIKLGKLIDALSKAPKPLSIAEPKIKEAEIDNNKVYVVILKASFKTKEEAEQFIALDNLLNGL